MWKLKLIRHMVEWISTELATIDNLNLAHVGLRTPCTCFVCTCFFTTKHIYHVSMNKMNIWLFSIMRLFVKAVVIACTLAIGQVYFILLSSSVAKIRQNAMNPWLYADEMVAIQFVCWVQRSESDTVYWCWFFNCYHASYFLHVLRHFGLRISASMCWYLVAVAARLLCRLTKFNPMPTNFPFTQTQLQAKR